MKIDAKKAVAATQFRRKPLITALEPRLLLDGAAVVTAIEMTTDLAYQDQSVPTERAVAPADLQPGDPLTPDGTNSAGSEPGAETALPVAGQQVVESDMALSENAPLDGDTPAAAEAANDEVSVDPTKEALTVEAVAPLNNRREVAFVDTQAEDYQVLVDSVPQGMEVHLINGDSNGLQQIADALQGQEGIDAIHVYSHGEQGQLNLGNLTLNGDNVRQYSDLLAQIGESMNGEADLMLYGCYVGADSAGQQFLDDMAELTGADVAASDDLTGSSDKGGDWNLEISVGSIETVARAQPNYQGLLAVPGIAQLSDFTYIEDSGVVQVDQDVAITGSGNFFGGYVEFALTGATTFETLGINRVSTADIVSGAISVVGNTVYRGDGTTAEVIGSVDSVHNGLNGESLRFNLLNSFQNGSFQTGSNGDTVITGWTVATGRMRLDGSYQIAGQATPVDSTYSSGNTSGDFSSGGTFTQTTNLSNYDPSFAGDLALELNTGSSSIAQPYGVIRGPAVYSNAAVNLQAGDQVSFDWKALSGGDAYDAYGYLVDVDTGDTITILDSTGTSANQETAWVTNTLTIAGGQEGNYRFVFVAGSFDFTGGQFLGGKLMIDDVIVTQLNPPMLSGADVSNLSHLVTYSNADQDFASGTRTLTLNVKDGTADSVGSATSTITLSLANDAPSFTAGATLGAVAEDTAEPTGSTVASLFSGNFSDPDAANTPADTLAGIAVVADASAAGDGVWEYSTTSGSDWHAIGTVSTTDALVLSASSLIRFRPTADWNGVPGSLSVHAVDSSYAGSFTSGATRTTFDTTTDGSTSPVSASAVALGTSITAVNDAPVAGDDSSSAVEAGGSGNAVAGTGSTGNVLGNDTDVDSGDTRAVSAIRTGAEAGSGTAGAVGNALSGSFGSLTINSDGSYTYVIDENNVSVQALRISGQTLTDSFTYTVRDTGGLTDQATVSITIDGRNDNPVGVDDTATAVEAGGVFNATAGANATGNVLGNDTDVDSAANGETQTVTSVRTGLEGGTGTAGAVGMLLVGTYGSLTLNANGSYTYVIDENNADVQALRISGQTVSESFTYTVSDAAGLTDQAMLTISIDGRNDSPVAATDDVVVAIEAGGVSNGTAGANGTGNVLGNDTDVDSGDTRVVSAIRTGAEAGSGTAGTVGNALSGSFGSLTINSDGSYTYVIDENNVSVQALRISGQTLTDSFTYTVRDTGGLTDQATVSITIDGRNDNPVGVDDTATAVEAGGVFNATAGANATGNVLGNDTDVDSAANGETQTVTSVRTGLEGGTGTAGAVGMLLVGTYGSLTLNANGSYTYVIDENNADVQALRISGQTVSESFTYTVSDAAGLTDQAMLTISIDGRNDSPVAVDDAATAQEAGNRFNTVAGFDAGGNVLSNDTDADSAGNGESRVVEGVRSGAESGTGALGTLGQPLTGAYGQLTLNADGSYTYVIDDTNPSVQALRISGQNLVDSFTYTVRDAGGLTDQATLSVTIDGRNDNPVGVDDTGTALEAGGEFNGTAGANGVGNVLTNDTDVDSAAGGETRTVTAVRLGAEGSSGSVGTVGQAIRGNFGSLTLRADGSYTYVVDNNNPVVEALRVRGQTLTESFSYTVTDAGGLSDEATLTITIEGQNDAPVATGANIPDQVWAFGKPFRLDISTPFSDVDASSNGETLSFSITGLPAGLTYNAGSGVISGAPSGIGVFVIRITASDQDGASIVREFSFEVLPPPTQASVQTVLPVLAPVPSDPMGGVSPVSVQSLGETTPLPSGTVGMGFTADPVLDVGYLTGSGLFDQQIAEGSTGLANANANADTDAGSNLGADADPGADDNAASSSQSKDSQKDIGAERLVMSEGSTRATEFVSPEGKVLSVKVSVQVDVGANGEVVFTDIQKRAFDIVGLNVTEIRSLDSGLKVSIFDQLASSDTQFYTGELGTGEPLPSWIRVDAKTGELTVGSPPERLDDLTVRIKAIGSDGKVRILELNLDDLLKKKASESTPSSEGETPPSAGFSPLANQVATAIAYRDSYGARLVALVDSA